MVPNRFPTLSSSKRIAVIAEHPNDEEVSLKELFTGMAGRFFSALISRAGIPREACYLGSITQRKPAKGLASFRWDGNEIQEGMAQLREDLERIDPHIVILLGNLSLKAAKDPRTVHPLIDKVFRNKVSKWRGSLFQCEHPASPFNGYKCIATHPPSYALRDYSVTPLLQFDLRKAFFHANGVPFVAPKRTLHTDLSADEIIFRLANIRELGRLTAWDIEGYVHAMSCISVATENDHAFIIPFTRKDGTAYWQNPADEQRIWRALAETLEDPKVGKVFQNSLYDRFVLHYSYGIRVTSVIEDTMLKHWENYSELEKALDVQASLYTNEPFYKGERHSQDDKTFYEYCCRDSAVTLEICRALDSFIKPPATDHYRLNVALLNPLLYMELRGIAYNTIGAEHRRSILLKKKFELQAKLNALTGFRFHWAKQGEIFAHARALMGFKKVAISTFDELAANCTKAYASEAARLSAIMVAATPDMATIGEVEDLCEVSLNLGSDDFRDYLYSTLKLPPQWKEKEDKETGGTKMVLTADYEALLVLVKTLMRDGHKEDSQPLQVLRLAIEIRALETRSAMLAIFADKDGRIRCGYNVVGTDTGRLSCYKSPTGSGYNLTTIPKYTRVEEAPGGIIGDRDLFLADDDHWFFQCDLKGADGWTVAAYAAMLGDTTMLEDYLFGLKPANILTLQLRKVDVNYADRKELKDASKLVDGDDWDYYAMKKVQHGASYLEGGPTISRSIFKDSEGKFYLHPNECKNLRDNFFFKRYWGIRKWHTWIENQLAKKSVLTAASGQVRQFLGRKDDRAMQAVAHEPQANTTYATNLAMYKLWTDADNRLAIHGLVQSGIADLSRPTNSSSCKLRIEPLHQVHDALCGQFKKTDTQWAVAKIKSYFANPLTIAGYKITIPFDGTYGPSWGEQGEKYGGGRI